VPSEETKKDLINYYEAKKNKIEVIYEGIKKKKTAEERKEFINNYSQNKILHYQILLLQFRHYV